MAAAARRLFGNRRNGARHLPHPQLWNCPNDGM